VDICAIWNGASMAIVEPNRDAEVMAKRRRHWLGIICAGLLLTIGIATWGHVEDPFDPYRDGTTHAATLSWTPPCLNSWGTSLDGGKYVWRVVEGVPDSFGNGPIAGRVHIIRQRSGTMGAVSATFEARGQTLPLYGGKEPVFFDANCAIR
jgi:hypothetical protein